MKLSWPNKRDEPDVTLDPPDTPISTSPTSPVALRQTPPPAHGREGFTTDVLPIERDPPSSISAAKSTEELLFEAMDQTAQDLLVVLRNNQIGEDGKPVVTIKQKESTFRLVMEWLAKSKRLRPDEGEAPMSVEAMRALIAEAKPKRGRPPKVRDNDGEGAALARALGADQ